MADNKRARNEVRTRDPQLGKLMLYQLSYSRGEFGKTKVRSTRQCSKSGTPEHHTAYYKHGTFVFAPGHAARGGWVVCGGGYFIGFGAVDSAGRGGLHLGGAR